jgi:hypothetical protein
MQLRDYRLTGCRSYMLADMQSYGDTARLVSIDTPV